MLNIIEKLEHLGVYVEKSFDDTWCYKHQFPGQDVVIVSNADQNKAAGRFFIEYLKSLHYSCRYLYEERRFDQLKELIKKMRSFDSMKIPE